MPSMAVRRPPEMNDCVAVIASTTSADGDRASTPWSGRRARCDLSGEPVLRDAHRVRRHGREVERRNVQRLGEADDMARAPGHAPVRRPAHQRPFVGYVDYTASLP